MGRQTETTEFLKECLTDSLIDLLEEKQLKRFLYKK